MGIINRRQNKILNEIVNEQYKTVEEYTLVFHVSEQTIRNDIKEINDTLKAKKQPFILTDDNGKFFIQGSQKIEENVIALLAKESNFYNYKLSQEERKTILAMILLNAEEYMTIAQLSELVFMSRNTLISDLDELKKWFDSNDMKLVSQTRKGFTVIGTEKSIRNGMLKLLLLNGDTRGHNSDDRNDIFKLLLLQELDKTGIVETIEKIIKLVEEENEIFLTDFSFRELVYELLIIVERLFKKRLLEEESSINWHELKQSSKYKIATDIENKLLNEFALWLPTQEIAHLIGTLRSKRYIKDNEKSIDMLDIQILINEFIYKISDRLSINYYLDFYLYDLLIEHMCSVVYRLKQKQDSTNPLLKQLLETYPEIFDIVKDTIICLEEYIKYTFSMDEISFIVMYIVAVMEKNKSRDVVVNVVIVCNTGRGTAQLISARLQSLSHQIKIVDIISSHNLTKTEEQKADMLISTIPLKAVTIPYLQVNAIMTENDLYEIQMLIMKIQEKKQKIGCQTTIDSSIGEEKNSLSEKDESFCNMLLESCIALDVEAKDWKEAIRKTGQLLLNAGIIEKRYIDAMIRNVEENGPYIVIYPGIAIPHAVPEDGALDTKAAIIRLKSNVNFHHEENDPVNYIIALSIKESDRVGKRLYSLTKLLRTGSFASYADTAVSAKELISFIKIMEHKIKTMK